LKNRIIIGSDIAKAISELKEKGGKNILMFGSPTAAHTLMEHNLIDDYWLFVNPVILGMGILYLMAPATIKTYFCKILSFRNGRTLF
jgi:dihydrofolate reductase